MEILKTEKYTCPKCHNNEFEKDQFQATGGTFAKLFEIQNKKFMTVTCTKCGYTEIYKNTSNDLENVLDFLIGN